jgi:hypothetical protein
VPRRGEVGVDHGVSELRLRDEGGRPVRNATNLEAGSGAQQTRSPGAEKTVEVV